MCKKEVASIKNDKIRSLEFKNGKTIDLGVVKTTKREKAILDAYDKRVREGKEIFYSFEPLSLWQKLDVKVKKDKRGNVSVFIKEKKK